MKYLKTFEGKYEDITYGDAMKKSKFDKEIKQHIEDNYPEHSYRPYGDKKKKSFITHGKSIGVGQAKKILALANRNKDIKLLGLLTRRFKNIEEVEMGMTAKKYNV